MTHPYKIIHLDTIDSTNRYLKDYTSKNKPSAPVFCITREQTHGYGQQQRRWQTNQHSAIFSLAYPLPPKSTIIGLLSLNIAALLHQSLTELTSDTLYLKWPNDLYNAQGKVAGILIEQIIKKDYQALIIGIGINRNHSELIDSASSTSPFDTESLLKRFFQKIQQTGLLDFSAADTQKYWLEHDFFLKEEPVRIITAENNEHIQYGTYLGINAQGQANIMIQDNLITLSSGQTSIRKMT